VGELSPRKGFDFIVESMANIPSQRRPALKLACNAIQPQERSYVESLAAMREVDLQILTSLNTDELRVLYNRAKLCVYAPHLEPFGLVPLEAMACGTPVVGIREGGVQESVIDGHSGLLVNRNPVDFAEAIEKFLIDPNLVKQYGLNARAHVEKNWSLENSTSQLEKYLYETQEL
jgi:glycosyltransferase involved in cell wall biosynthesis